MRSTKPGQINGRSRPTVEVWEECETCYGSGCVDAPYSGSDPCCPECDGEGKVLVTEQFGGKDERRENS